MKSHDIAKKVKYICSNALFEVFAPQLLVLIAKAKFTSHIYINVLHWRNFREGEKSPQKEKILYRVQLNFQSAGDMMEIPVVI